MMMVREIKPCPHKGWSCRDVACGCTCQSDAVKCLDEELIQLVDHKCIKQTACMSNIIYGR